MQSSCTLGESEINLEHITVYYPYDTPSVPKTKNNSDTSKLSINQEFQNESKFTHAHLSDMPLHMSDINCKEESATIKLSYGQQSQKYCQNEYKKAKNSMKIGKKLTLESYSF